RDLLDPTHKPAVCFRLDDAVVALLHNGILPTLPDPGQVFACNILPAEAFFLLWGIDRGGMIPLASDPRARYHSSANGVRDRTSPAPAGTPSAEFRPERLASMAVLTASSLVKNLRGDCVAQLRL